VKALLLRLEDANVRTSGADRDMPVLALLKMRFLRNAPANTTNEKPGCYINVNSTLGSGIQPGAPLPGKIFQGLRKTVADSSDVLSEDGAAHLLLWLDRDGGAAAATRFAQVIQQWGGLPPGPLSATASPAPTPAARPGRTRDPRC